MLLSCLKKNLNAPRPSEHPPVWVSCCYTTCDVLLLLLLLLSYSDYLQTYSKFLDTTYSVYNKPDVQNKWEEN